MIINLCSEIQLVTAIDITDTELVIYFHPSCDIYSSLALAQYLQFKGITQTNSQDKRNYVPYDEHSSKIHAHSFSFQPLIHAHSYQNPGNTAEFLRQVLLTIDEYQNLREFRLGLQKMMLHEMRKKEGLAFLPKFLKDFALGSYNNEKLFLTKSQMKKIKNQISLQKKADRKEFPTYSLANLFNSESEDKSEAIKFLPSNQQSSNDLSRITCSEVQNMIQAKNTDDSRDMGLAYSVIPITVLSLLAYSFFQKRRTPQPVAITNSSNQTRKHKIK